MTTMNLGKFFLQYSYFKSDYLDLLDMAEQFNTKRKVKKAVQD